MLILHSELGVSSTGSVNTIVKNMRGNKQALRLCSSRMLTHTTDVCYSLGFLDKIFMFINGLESMSGVVIEGHNNFIL